MEKEKEVTVNEGVVEPVVEDPLFVEEKVPETPPESILKKDDSVDETGVPWKNRAMEEKRKREELEQQQYQRLANETEEERLVKEEQFYNVDRSVIKTTRQIAREEAEEMAKSERIAMRITSNSLNSIETEFPEIHKYRNEIEQELDMIPTKDKMYPTFPILIRKIALATAGEYEFKKPKKVIKQTVTPPINANSNASGQSASISLTDDEIAFANSRNYFNLGFTEKEIRQEYEARQEKFKKMEGK